MLGLAAALSSPALAETGEPVLTPMSLPGLAEVAGVVLEDVGSVEPGPLAEVDPATLLPAVPAQMTAAEPVTAGAVSGPPPAPVSEAPAEAAPELRPSPDPPAPPTVEQTSSTNVNVSIRVDSPGDDGAVVQENATAATGPQYQPDAPQYQEPTTTTRVPEPESTPDPVTTPETVPGTGEWNWTWRWNCGDSIPELPATSDVALRNWVWNWEWKCAEPDETKTDMTNGKTSQYQPVTTQYRPININVSIRINSSGNNGPVVQTNVAVVATSPTQMGVVSVVQQAQAATMEAVPAPTPVEAASVEDSAAIDATLPELVSVSDDCCVLPAPKGVATAAPAPASVLLPQAPPAKRRDITARARFRAAVAVTIRLAEASSAVARATRPLRKPPRLVRPAPRRPAAPMRAQVVAPSAAGLVSLNAPDGRLGHLVLLVAGIAFAFAFAHASRSVAAEVRAAGEDPDPPPARPG